MFYPNEPIINASNIAQHLGYESQGRVCGTFARRAPVGSIYGAVAVPDSFDVIPRPAWPDLIRQMEADSSRLSDFVLGEEIPSLNQEQTLYCHGNSPCAAVEFLRAVQGLPYVPLSAASIAGPTVNFRNQGGYIANDLEQVCRVGCASQYFVPANQVGQRGFRPGWESDAANYRALEWWDLGHRTRMSFDLMMTLLFARIPVCVAYNWWGHAVTMTDPVILPNGHFGARGRNSWGNSYGAYGFFVLDEQYATPDEAYALRSIVQGRVDYRGMKLLSV